MFFRCKTVNASPKAWLCARDKIELSKNTTFFSDFVWKYKKSTQVTKKIHIQVDNDKNGDDDGKRSLSIRRRGTSVRCRGCTENKGVHKVNLMLM